MRFAQSFYVYNTSASESGSVNSSDMQAAKNLAATYAKILGSNAVVDTVINDLDDINGQQRTALRNNIRVNGVNDTQVIEVKVITDSRDLSYQIADSFSRIAPKEVIRIAKVGNIEVLDQPEMPNKNPHRERFMIQCSVSCRNVTRIRNYLSQSSFRYDR